MQKSTFTYIIIGAVLVIGTSFAVFFIAGNMNDDQSFCMKIILGLGASAFMVALPGAIEFNLNKIIHASGVMAIFCIVLFYDYIIGSDKEIAKDNPIELCNLSGNIELINSNGSSIMPPYDGINLVISPPIAGEKNGNFFIKNIPIDTTDKITPVVLRISKNGFFGQDITIGENLWVNQGKFDIIKKGKNYTINPGKNLVLKKNDADPYWAHSNSEYNPQNIAVAVQDTSKN